MLGIFLFQRFLNRMDDYKFEKYWVERVLAKQRMYLGVALIYFFVALFAITELLLIGNTSFLIGFLIVALTLVVYGGYFLRSILRFIGFNNGRYLQIKTGLYQDNAGFNKDNVVG